MTVQPIICEVGAMAGLGLCDFIRMMHRNVVFTASVYVEERAQVCSGHSRTLNMPAREPYAPRTLPLHLALMIGWAELPQRKVSGVALFPHVYTYPSLQTGDIQLGQMPIAREFGGIEIKAIRSAIGKAFCLNAADDLDLLRDVRSGSAPNRRLQ